MQVIIGLIMFMFLVLVHEFGHFAVAKLSGIKVNEFSIGMGPVLTQFTKNETEYSIRLLPLGGYVAMEGEDEESPDPRSYTNAKAYQKFLTILAGPVMNLLTAFLIFAIIFGSIGVGSLTIESVDQSSPAQLAGLQAGDTITKVEGKNVSSFAYIPKIINDSMTSGRESIDIEYKRNGERITAEKIVPEKVEGSYIVGFHVKKIEGFFGIIKEAFLRVFFIMGLLWETLGSLFSGKLGLNALSGPVGVVQQVGNAASQGAATLFMFLAVISINLGFFNLLPIPALDGSKLLFIIVEKIMGRPLNKKFEQRVTIVGFVLLLGLIALVSIKDIYMLFK